MNLGGFGCWLDNGRVPVRKKYASSQLDKFSHLPHAIYDQSIIIPSGATVARQMPLLANKWTDAIPPNNAPALWKCVITSS
jgi:hypothetical protein